MFAKGVAPADTNARRYLEAKRKWENAAPPEWQFVIARLYQRRQQEAMTLRVGAKERWQRILADAEGLEPRRVYLRDLGFLPHSEES